MEGIKKILFNKELRKILIMIIFIVAAYILFVSEELKEIPFIYNQF